MKEHFVKQKKTRTGMRYVIWIVAAVCIGLVWVIWYQNADRIRLTGGTTAADGTRVIHVIYDQAGYHPRDITIEERDEVVFENKSNIAFWPASNPHPVHNIYSIFDPKVPVLSGQSWSFRFEKSGTWNYHDHIQPSFYGTVTVVKKGQQRFSMGDVCRNPSKLDYASKEQCWEKELTGKIRKGDISGALASFARFYKTDKDFSLGCHFRAHLVGDAFYTYIAKRRPLSSIDLPPETTYCGYGFYHGLFEHMVREAGDTDVAGRIQTMCTELDKKYHSTIPLMRINCFHGAGHGIMPDPPETALWGKAQPIIDPKLTLCDSVSTDKGEIEQCYEGIYNVLVDWTWREQYGFAPDPVDPFVLCKAQKPQYQRACYYEYVMRVSDFKDDKMNEEIVKYIDPIEDFETAKIVAISLVAGYMSRSVLNDDQSEYIARCRNVPARFAESCLMGVMMGFRAHGEPGEEYKKALTFCKNPQLTAPEKLICYRELVINNRYVYDEAKVQTICKEFEQPYQNFCTHLPP